MRSQALSYHSGQCVFLWMRHCTVAAMQDRAPPDFAYFFQAIYGSGGAAPGADAAAGGADAGPKGGDDNVVDAEFTDTDK